MGHLKGILFVCSLIAGAVLTLRFEELKIPKYVLRGRSADLTCLVDAEGEVLYSLKWYKETRLFYQFIPKNARVKYSYPLAGVHVHMEESHGGRIRLLDAQLETSGEYRCEAITEGPPFHTAIGNGSLTVVIAPVSAPVLEGFKDSYSLGETIDVNCTSYLSRPAVNLKWFVNDVRLNSTSALLRRYANQMENGLETVVLGLYLRATRSKFPNGELRLKCIASIGDIYYISQEKSVLATNFLPQSQAKESRGFFFLSSKSPKLFLREETSLIALILLARRIID